MERVIKNGGIALVLAGLCFIITNAGISPFVNFEAPYSELLTSQLFLTRMIFAALTAFFLLFGAVGLILYQIQMGSAKFLGYFGFWMSIAGSAFLLANEWHQIFILPEIAAINPDAIDRLNTSDNFGGYDLAAIIAITSFTVGWILFALSTLISKKIKPLGPALVIAGFFVLPLLSGILTPVWGGAIGSILLGLGFSLIGRELIKVN